MEHARKFLLVSADSIGRFSGAVAEKSDSYRDRTGSMRREMDNLLSRRDIPDDRKLIEYGQKQFDYFSHRDAMNKPLKIDIRDSRDEEELKRNKDKPKVVLDSATDFFQQAYRENAKGLGRFLMESAPNIKWNSRGEVIINDQLIRDSNLLALMDDVLRRRVSKHPAGYREFATALQQANIPENLIGEKSGVYKEQIVLDRTPGRNPYARRRRQSQYSAWWERGGSPLSSADEYRLAQEEQSGTNILGNWKHY